MALCPALSLQGGWRLAWSPDVFICSSWDVTCPRSSQEGVPLNSKTLLVTDEAKGPGPSVPSPHPEQARGPGHPVRALPWMCPRCRRHRADRFARPGLSGVGFRGVRCSVPGLCHPAPCSEARRAPRGGDAPSPCGRTLRRRATVGVVGSAVDERRRPLRPGLGGTEPPRGGTRACASVASAGVGAPGAGAAEGQVWLTSPDGAPGGGDQVMAGPAVPTARPPSPGRLLFSVFSSSPSTGKRLFDVRTALGDSLDWIVRHRSDSDDW